MSGTTSFSHVAKPTFCNILWFLTPIILGIFLRLYDMQGQILLDDEWHSLNFVLGKSFFAVLTTHGMGANCIPQNLINWILLHTIGWSEWTLTLPSLLCSVLGLLLFPCLISRIAGRAVAIFFVCLLAISPCAIFYSRIARPYSMVIFFGFLSLLYLALWVLDGRSRHLFAYALSGFAAIYFHIYAAIPVLAPLVALFILTTVRRAAGKENPWISMKNLLRIGALLAILVALFLGPAHWRNPWWISELGTSHVNLSGLWEFLSMLGGTRLAVSKLLFAALVGYGLLAWLRKEFRVGLLFLSVWVSFSLFLVFATQTGMHAAIQVARYNIILFPVAMLPAAFALDRLLAHSSSAILPHGHVPLGILLIAGLIAGSPLWETYDPPNNFTHHSAFQDSYAPFDWSQSRIRALSPLPQMPKERIPAFYLGLAADPSMAGIIEYPMFIGDPLNFYYFYQHFHRKPVAIGYVSDFSFPPLAFRDDLVHQETPIDYVFSRAQSIGESGQMRFSNMIPLMDISRLRRGHHKWLLVLHKDILQETLGIQGYANIRPPVMLHMFLTANLGQPAFSDDQIMAWRIP